MESIGKLLYSIQTYGIVTIRNLIDLSNFHGSNTNNGTWKEKGTSYGRTLK